MDDKDYIKASSRWLFEMNFLNNGYVKNALYANVYNASPAIKDAEILVDQHNRRMLIFLKLTFIGRLFRQKANTTANVELILKDALPEYEFRVVYDKELFDKATRLLNPTPPPEKEEPKEEEPETSKSEEA